MPQYFVSTKPDVRKERTAQLTADLEKLKGTEILDGHGLYVVTVELSDAALKEVQTWGYVNIQPYRELKIHI
jgi:hypothetical protein